MTKFKNDRRSGLERRKFNYTKYIPERRSGKDRRTAKNGKDVPWVILADELQRRAKRSGSWKITF